MKDQQAACPLPALARRHETQGTAPSYEPWDMRLVSPPLSRPSDMRLESLIPMPAQRYEAFSPSLDTCANQGA